MHESIETLQKALQNGDQTATSLTETALSRLEPLSSLNALAHIDGASALKAAGRLDEAQRNGKSLGALAGIPMAHKDLFFRENRLCDCGSRVLAKHCPTETATVLERLDAAGAIDLGTLHMAEIAMSPTGFNAHFGHGKNPINPDYISGGSSSGSGIAVAAGAIPAALGTDTGGSIRHPAAACGLTGLKPTHGGVSLAGVMRLAPGLDTVGPLAKTAADVAAIMEVIWGPDERDPATLGAASGRLSDRIKQPVNDLAVNRVRGYYDESLDAEVDAALTQLCATLADLGVKIGESRIQTMDTENAMAHLTLSCEASAEFYDALTHHPEQIAPQVRARLSPGLSCMATDYVKARYQRKAIKDAWVKAAIGNSDLALLPIFPIPVPTISATTEGTPEQIATTIGLLTRNTRAINYLGLPALAVPVGICRNGLPIGVQLVGRPWAEPLLLQIGHAIQSITQWHQIPIQARVAG